MNFTKTVSSFLFFHLLENGIDSVLLHFLHFLFVLLEYYECRGLIIVFGKILLNFFSLLLLLFYLFLSSYFFLFIIMMQFLSLMPPFLLFLYT